MEQKNYTMDTIRVSRFSAWAPGMDSQAAWMEWARGKREITLSKDAPSLDYTEPLFRRRLSQISRMCIQVLHELLPLGEGMKVFFLSFRGEISQQFRINKMIIEDGSVMPAAFSLSVFNTPPALASMALNLGGGYSAVYPSGDQFYPGLLAAAAPVLTGTAGETVLAYADELVPAEYGTLRPPEARPLAFAVLFSRDSRGVSLPEEPFASPEDFLRYLYLKSELNGNG
ncbi:beta-ketoacyl synthase chain length factor [Treponema primitia]|uniref:beta-ketoacyl synthase chain length factor n=1 Tax=Treponema primitia TaxID=88058 RepID=UPI00397FDA79